MTTLALPPMLELLTVRLRQRNVEEVQAMGLYTRDGLVEQARIDRLDDAHRAKGAALVADVAAYLSVTDAPAAERLDLALQHFARADAFDSEEDALRERLVTWNTVALDCGRLVCAWFEQTTNWLQRREGARLRARRVAAQQAALPELEVAG